MSWDFLDLKEINCMSKNEFEAFCDYANSGAISDSVMGDFRKMKDLSYAFTCGMRSVAIT